MATTAHITHDPEPLEALAPSGSPTPAAGAASAPPDPDTTGAPAEDGGTPATTLLTPDRVQRWAPFAAFAALAVLALVVPVVRGGSTPSALSAPAPAAARGVPTAPPTSDTTATAPSADAPVAAAGDTFAAGDRGAGAAPASQPSFGSSFGGSTGTSSGDTASRSFDAGPPPAEPAPTPATPLRIREGGWASATGPAAPVTGASVPADAFPVAAEAGQDQRRSYVRLSGTATTLTLTLSGSPGANVGADGAAVAACPITTAGWKPVRGGSFADAPPFDAARCVPATRNPAGAFVFDLTRFSDRDGPAGFALVPTPGGTATFQVAFAPS